jgi:aminoglycoside phosphotransferase (APT) family kinase protein
MAGEEEKTKRIASFLREKGWLRDFREVKFLAAGEYNENYSVHTDDKTYVFRINHGSQLNITNQIEYEYAVLKNLAESGVTPKPYHCDPSPAKLDGGVLLMDYLEGSPLIYERDLEKAAFIFAKVHSQLASEDLIVQERPVYDIAKESRWLIHRYAEHPLTDVRDTLLRYHDEIISLAEKTKNLFEEERMCIVNTEVNSGNFIINNNRGWLVDWEKAVVSYRYQDLGHFLIPTTTLWKTNYSFDAEAKKKFLRAYFSYIDERVPFDELVEKTEVLARTILLRALSWCYMAYYEYTRGGRELKNSFTFDRIKKYLKEAECFLK